MSQLAQKTFMRLGLQIGSSIQGAKVYQLKHPAARDWTKVEIEKWKVRLQEDE